ncbi:MAG: hypothetical protein CMP12_13090 [Zunongwangia sp.]|uniref:Uncharacterized protein n=1 Tax=Zunongwangia profunda TaxID=398743 RepID=A0A3D5IXA5_9FLAO|tara:strand:- start:4791 stop:5015 length:225 start_codon:yes stop_codon:yes gene_type:complete
MPGTNRPKSVAQFDPSYPPEIHLISAWNASMEIEKDLHKEFDLFRVRGEWFDLNIRDLERLNNYMLKFERIKVL